jgi:hypothetical protein
VSLRLLVAAGISIELAVCRYVICDDVSYDGRGVSSLSASTNLKNYFYIASISASVGWIKTDAPRIVLHWSFIRFLTVHERYFLRAAVLFWLFLGR